MMSKGDVIYSEHGTRWMRESVGAMYVHEWGPIAYDHGHDT